MIILSIIFRTVFNVNLNDVQSYPSTSYELLVGTLSPKWERINAYVSFKKLSSRKIYFDLEVLI